jgi:hypothetical protein
LRSLLQDLNLIERTLYATIIYCDNQGAITLVKDPKFHPQTRHIAIQHYWVREEIAEQIVDLEYIQTSKQVADSLTKALPKDSFEAYRGALGLEGIWGMTDVKKAIYSSWGSVEMPCTLRSSLFCIKYRGGSHPLPSAWNLSYSHCSLLHINTSKAQLLWILTSFPTGTVAHIGDAEA